MGELEQLQADVQKAKAQAVRVGQLFEGEERARKAETKVLSDRLDRVEATAAAIIESMKKMGGKSASGPSPEAQVCWLLPEEGRDDHGLLFELMGWVNSVYLKFEGADPGKLHARPILTGCWLRHPSVVQELWVLYSSWKDAYVSTSGNAGMASVWHQQLRPGVVARINAVMEGHHPRAHASAEWEVPEQVGGLDDLEALGHWYAGDQASGLKPPTIPAQVLSEHDRARRHDEL